MANTGRYVYCPMTSKIRGNRRTLREKILRWIRAKDREVDMYEISNAEVYYPAGYKK